jgi:hypothetical protein
MGNAGMWQAFAMNDQTTARYLSERLGKRVLWRKTTGEAFLLRRTPYDKLFPRGRYMPDPFENGGLQ